MKRLLLAAVLALIPDRAYGQTPRPDPVDASLATPTRHEVSVVAGGYNYIEPGDLRISIHGAKFGGEYSGTFGLHERQKWFATVNARATFGTATYDGWCAPSVIVPDDASPNGYALSLGEFSPCVEPGARDWYAEVRGLVGRDRVGRKWAAAFVTGLGVRYLSNGTGDIPGFRTSTYLYLPLGITARTRVASHGTLSLRFEYDVLIRGWQRTRNSALGGAEVPATATEPAFSIAPLDDFSFAQSGGWALRVGAKYQLNQRWSLEPYYIHWRIDDSAVVLGTLSLTVNGVTAEQPFGAVEPRNVTRESGVKLAFRF
jgi:hypothetical protein